MGPEPAEILAPQLPMQIEEKPKPTEIELPTKAIAQPEPAEILAPQLPMQIEEKPEPTKIEVPTEVIAQPEPAEILDPQPKPTKRSAAYAMIYDETKQGVKLIHWNVYEKKYLPGILIEREK